MDAASAGRSLLALPRQPEPAERGEWVDLQRLKTQILQRDRDALAAAGQDLN
jgi:hypothetical protein